MIILLQSSTSCLCNAFFDLHTSFSFFFSIKEFVPQIKFIYARFAKSKTLITLYIFFFTFLYVIKHIQTCNFCTSIVLAPIFNHAK